MEHSYITLKFNSTDTSTEQNMFESFTQFELYIYTAFVAVAIIALIMLGIVIVNQFAIQIKLQQIYELLQRRHREDLEKKDIKL